MPACLLCRVILYLKDGGKKISRLPVEIPLGLQKHLALSSCHAEHQELQGHGIKLHELQMGTELIYEPLSGSYVELV